MEPNTPTPNTNPINPTNSATSTPITPNTSQAPVSDIPKRPSIHTLEGDIFSAVKDENYSSNIVKIATRVKPSDNSGSGYLNSTGTNSSTKKIIIGAIILMVLIIAIGAYIVLKNSNQGNVADLNNPTATTTENNPSLQPDTIQRASVLDTEAVIKIDLKNLNKNQGVEKVRQIQQELRNKNISPNTSVEIDLGLTMPDFFAKNQYSGDEALIRGLGNNYSFGLFNNKDNVFETFIVLKINSFDLTFSAMLSWEPYMYIDLVDMFKDTTEKKIVASTTATSSTPVVTPIAMKAGFKDKVIRNTDTRIYTDEQGEVRLVYGFINKDYLVITGGVESFIDIKTRLLNKNTLR
jgi:hypothetical protein